MARGVLPRIFVLAAGGRREREPEPDVWRGTAEAPSPHRRTVNHCLAHEAQRHEQKGELDEALHAAVRATELTPEDEVAWALRARVRAQKGDYDRALADAERAFELDPSDVRTGMLVAQLRGVPLDRTAQVGSLSETVRRDPGNGPTWRALAWGRAEQGDFAGAIDAATQALAIDPQDASALRVKSWARSETGDSSGAIADKDAAARLDPRHAVPQRLTLPTDLAEVHAQTREQSRNSSNEAERLVADARSRTNVREIASTLQAVYALGQRDRANELLGGSVRPFDDQEAGAVATCRFLRRNHGAEIELTIERRPGVEGPLAVAFPPGTYAEAPTGPASSGGHEDEQSRPERWPRPQDLAILRAPVLVLEATENRASTCVPIACAAFNRAAPYEGLRYQLRRFEAGSATDRVLQVLCRGEKPPEGTASQLALWIAANRIEWRKFMVRTEGSWYPFSGERVNDQSIPESARILVRAAVEPEESSFFGQAGNTAPPSTGEDP